MSIVENSVSEIGDVLLIQSFTPLFGIIDITGYVDTTLGETGTRFFKKEFSYSIDGIFFSDWIELSDPALIQIVVNVTNAFYINYRYTRAGTDMTGTLSFVDITLDGHFDQPLCPNYYILPKSIFKDIFCYNPAQAHLCAILTNKLFQRGILPDYITRNEGLNPPVDDKDFLDFWGTVCCFYSLMLLFAENLTNFGTNQGYLLEYLRERDVMVCDDTELQDLNYIKTNYLDEIRQRGTIQIFIPKSGTKVVDGEFLRLICYDVNDEFRFDLITGERLGWWLGKSSPSYRGNSLSLSTIKNKEKTADFVDLTLYNTFNDSGGSISIVTDGSKKVAHLEDVPDGFKVGFSYNLTTVPATNFDNAVIVDDNVDYEVSFWVKQNIQANNLTFGCMGFDINNNQIVLLDVTTGSTQQFFFTQQHLNQTDKYYFVKGIIYNKYKALLTNDQAHLNIGYGKNLKFNYGVKKIIPVVLLDRTTNPNITSDLYIWDLKVKPLVTGVVANKVYSDISETAKVNNRPLLGNFGTCFLTARNLLHIMYVNNNAAIQTADLETVTREKLIPYNSFLKTTIINTESDDS